MERKIESETKMSINSAREKTRLELRKLKVTQAIVLNKNKNPEVTFDWLAIKVENLVLGTKVQNPVHFTDLNQYFKFITTLLTSENTDEIKYGVYCIRQLIKKMEELPNAGYTAYFNVEVIELLNNLLDSFRTDKMLIYETLNIIQDLTYLDESDQFCSLFITPQSLNTYIGILQTFFEESMKAGCIDELHYNSLKQISKQIVSIIGNCLGESDAAAHLIIKNKMFQILYTLYHRLKEDQDSIHFLYGIICFIKYSNLLEVHEPLLIAKDIVEITPSKETGVELLKAIFLLSESEELVVFEIILNSNILLEYGNLIYETKNKLLISAFFRTIVNISIINDKNTGIYILKFPIYQVLMIPFNDEAFKLHRSNALWVFSNVASDSLDSKLKLFELGVYDLILQLLSKQSALAELDQISYFMGNMVESLDDYNVCQILIQIFNHNYFKVLADFLKSIELNEITIYTKTIFGLLSGLNIHLILGEHIIYSEYSNPAVMRFVEADGFRVLERIRDNLSNPCDKESNNLRNLLVRMLNVFFKRFEDSDNSNY